MKIALLNDTHFGARNDSPAFIKYFNRFYDEIFFPYLQEHNITTLIHLGDVVDRRKFINYNTAHNFQQKFWKRLWDMKIDTHIILGNHDTYYKNTNEINAMQQLAGQKGPSASAAKQANDTGSNQGIKAQLALFNQLAQPTAPAARTDSPRVAESKLDASQANQPASAVSTDSPRGVESKLAPAPQSKEEFLAQLAQLPQFPDVAKLGAAIIGDDSTVTENVTLQLSKQDVTILAIVRHPLPLKAMIKPHFHSMMVVF